MIKKNTQEWVKIRITQPYLHNYNCWHIFLPTPFIFFISRFRWSKYFSVKSIPVIFVNARILGIRLLLFLHKVIYCFTIRAIKLRENYELFLFYILKKIITTDRISNEIKILNSIKSTLQQHTTILIHFNIHKISNPRSLYLFYKTCTKRTLLFYIQKDIYLWKQSYEVWCCRKCSFDSWLHVNASSKNFFLAFFILATCFSYFWCRWTFYLIISNNVSNTWVNNLYIWYSCYIVYYYFDILLIELYLLFYCPFLFLMWVDDDLLIFVKEMQSKIIHSVLHIYLENGI